MTKPQTTDYDDYRAYLSELITHMRHTTRGFSFRKFSRRAGYQSPNFLKLVVEGQRNISEDSIHRFAQAFDLNSTEEKDFGHLVRFNQSKTDIERNKNYRLLKRHRPGPASEILAAQYDIYSQWFALPIRELATLPNFKEDPTWIASKFIKTISPTDAKRALNILQKVGLLVRDKVGRLKAASASLKTGAAVPLAVRNFHRAMLEQAQNALDGMHREQRHVSSLTQALTKEQYEELCQRVDVFREELLHVMENENKTGSKDAQIYFVGFEVIPLTSAPNE